MIRLNGHSGCNVVLFDGVVRKTSSSVAYNDRLKNQMDKQMRFAHTAMLAPEVFGYGYDDCGRFYFEMEYIRGESLTSIFLNRSTHDAIAVIDQITQFTPTGYMDAKPIIEQKLNDLSVPSDDCSTILSCDWQIPLGYCHGDLTFENVIVSKGRVFLIDFLDSFLDSPIVDESKILQDAFCYWSFGALHVPKRKLLSVCRKFDTKRHYCMLLLHLFRIVPYANVQTKETLKCMMEKVRTQINQY